MSTNKPKSPKPATPAPAKPSGTKKLPEVAPTLTEFNDVTKGVTVVTVIKPIK